MKDAIDLISRVPESKRADERRVKRNAAILEGNQYTFHALHADLNSRILATALPDMYIAEVGAVHPRFTADQLQSHKAKMLLCDDDDQTVLRSLAGLTDECPVDALLVDLCATQKFLNTADLRGHIESSGIEETATETRLRLSLEECGIGTIVFSHVLVYLEQRSARSLLMDAISQLPPGGSVFIVDKSEATYRTGNKRTMIERSQAAFLEARNICREDSALEASELWTGPVLTELQYETLSRLVEELIVLRARSRAIHALTDKMPFGDALVSVGSYDFTDPTLPDPCGLTIRMADNTYFMPEFAEHILHIHKAA